MAYVRYQTVIEQFYPPNSKWVKKSKEKMLAVLENGKRI
jgi:hypothetical protein